MLYNCNDLPSCKFLIHKETCEPFKIFSKNTPEKPLEKHATRTAKRPIKRSEFK